MNRDFKLLITDLDGTALPLAGYADDIPQANIAAVKKATQQGKIVSIATGRLLHKKGFLDIAAALGVTCPVVIEGGTRIIDPVTSKTIWEKHLPHEAAQAILDIFVKFAGDNGHIMHDNYSWYQAREKPMLAKDVKLDKPRFIYLEDIPSKDAYEVANAINTADFSAVGHVTKAIKGPGYHSVHVVHSEGTKEHGIQQLMKIFGVTKEETIGMGDSGNDIPLIEGVGFGVAVGNAGDEIKEIADYIAPNQEDAALAHVIEKFLLDS